MSFLLFLFLLFVLYFIVWPILKTIFFVRKVRKNFYSKFNQGPRRQSTQQKEPKKEKIIGKDVGEYVSYKEISSESATYKETTSDDVTVGILQENQTEDIEWEDI